MKNYNPTSTTWMVMVNGKYMVKATFEDEKSACGAEHFFLDEIRWGIKGAQAFSKDEMRTEFFADALMYCDFKTVDEIREMSATAKCKHDADVARVQEKIDALQAQIKALSYELNGAMNRDTMTI